MNERIMLGIDCGGTHTDGALLAVRDGKGVLLADVKTATRHEDLPGCIAEVIGMLRDKEPEALAKTCRATLGTTLEINALVQGKADAVGLALSAGPGLDPAHFAIGQHVCIVPGGLDHRGVEVSQLYTDALVKEVAAWPGQGIAAIACVGKFSPRNPAHENEMAKVCASICNLPISLGHKLSGRLNFPRRIATAYYNAAVGRIHNEFLTAVDAALAGMGIQGQLRLLKADGGAIPFAASRREPVQSILSGPAASVMGCMAVLSKDAAQDCVLLLDMGGTTTDIALVLHGSPVVDRKDMAILGRRTLVRSLASISIGIGGDSLLACSEQDGLKVGPQRIGPPMAFGGVQPTLLDALNALDGENSSLERGNVAASQAGIQTLARNAGMECKTFAQQAVQKALDAVLKAVYNLVEDVNSGPIYTLAGLKAAREARPKLACLAGGPANCIQGRLQAALGMETFVLPHADVANAIGAALTRPTASLEIYADTGRGEMSAPALNLREKIPASWNIEQAKARCLELLRLSLAADGIEDARVEVVEADLFATLDDRGRSSRDMRVSCQATPGIVATLEKCA